MAKHPRMSAVLAVDVQNDFCPGGSLEVPRGDEVVAPLNNMIACARKLGWPVIASRDWHPPVTVHFDKWAPHCIRDTPGGEFEAGLDLTDAIVVSKGQGLFDDGYSVFDGVTADFKAFRQVLADNCVVDLYVGGLALDYCVKATVLEACQAGFRTYVMLDACRGLNLNPDDSQLAMSTMVKAGAILTRSDIVIAKL